MALCYNRYCMINEVSRLCHHINETMMPSSQRPRCRRRRPITKNRQTNSHEQTSCSPPEPEHSTRRRRRRSSFAILVIAQTALLAVSSMVVPFLLPAGVSAHGYLKTPRSRNLVACEFIFFIIDLFFLVNNQQQRRWTRPCVLMVAVSVRSFL